MFSTLKKIELKAGGASSLRGFFQFFGPLVGTAPAPSGAKSVKKIVLFEGEAT